MKATKSDIKRYIRHRTRTALRKRQAQEDPERAYSSTRDRVRQVLQEHGSQLPRGQRDELERLLHDLTDDYQDLQTLQGGVVARSRQLRILVDELVYRLQLEDAER